MSEASPGNENGMHDPTEATNLNQDKENSVLTTGTAKKNDSTNSCIATTSKPVAVVTPKQPDRPRSDISSTSVHKSTTFRSPSNQLPNMACPSFYRKQKRCSTEVLEENVKIAQRGKKTLPPESQTEETPNKKRKFERENSPAKPASPVKLSRDEATLNETVTETKQKRSKTTKKRTKEKTDKLKLKTLKRVNHTEGQEREEHVLKALKKGIYGTRDELEEDLADYVKEKRASRCKKVKKSRRIVSGSVCCCCCL